MIRLAAATTAAATARQQQQHYFQTKYVLAKSMIPNKLLAHKSTGKPVALWSTSMAIESHIH